MLIDKYKRELEHAAENVANHTVELISSGRHAEIWRCTNQGSSCYGFDLAISRFGMAMYGDMDSLVFKVGSLYGIEFLARSSVCGYMIEKLEPEYRDKRELAEDKLKNMLIQAGCELLEQQFVAYVDSDSCEYTELAPWVSQGASWDLKDITLDMVIDEAQKHAPEQEHLHFENFTACVEHVLEESAPNGLKAVEFYLSENYEELNLGPEWYETSISQYEGSLIQKLEMLRICAHMIKKVKDAGDGSEEHAD